MRIGQLARKHDISVQEILTYLEEELALDADLHPNYKLDEATEEKIFAYFDIAIEEPAQEEPTEEEAVQEEEATSADEVIEEEPNDEPQALENSEDDKINEPQQDVDTTEAPTIKVPIAELTPEEEIAALDGDLATEEERSQVEAKKETKEVVADEKPAAPKEDEVIQTDKLLELLEAEDAPADLDKIKLIKAPKKELAGLKVVGKVELPEPKKKEEKEEKEPEEKEFLTERDLRDYRYPNRKKKRREPLTDEEKEARRLKAKAKKEAYLAREEKRRKEKEAQQLKERKAAHYKQKLTKAETTQKKKAKAKVAPQTTPAKQKKETPARPKTIFGKFWRWLNASPYE